MHRSSLFVLFFAIFAVTTLGLANESSVDVPGEASSAAMEALSSMDRTADPCQDFYRYACGSWLDKTERPADRAIWGRSFSVINDRNETIVRELLEEAKSTPSDDPDQQKIGAYYGACMDEEAVEEAGGKPIQPLLEMVSKVEDAESLLAVTGKLQRLNVGAVFGLGVFPDFANPDLNIAWFFQGGLGMPDRDYYVSEEEQKLALLKEYSQYVATMFALLGESEEDAAASAESVLAFETELAKASRPAQEMRDFERLYNKIDLQGLSELTPDLPWKTFFAAAGYPDIEDISVATPEFFERWQSLVAETEAEVIQTYLKWHVVRSFARYLSADFVDANFEFYGKKLAGQQEIRPRWKRCVTGTQAALGEVIGKLYVARQFAGSSKDIATEMIHDIEKAFEINLVDLSWMDDETRKRAMLKVGTLQNKIGYPDKWRDYSALELTESDYFANVLAALENEYDFNAAKVGQPVDRSEWGMTPQMVNAYYNPLWNEIVFPAGILQPPFFHKDAPAALNYGSIGGVIGHELTHGFDDQGRKFGPDGKLAEWWEPQVEENFEAQAQCVDDFYQSYELEPGIHVNGKLTLGENIADLGGLKQAHQAFQLWQERHADIPPAVKELTDEQLLFVAWAQSWCSLASPEIERLQVTTDPHSPARFRAVGPLANSPAFAKAFSCEVGTAMNPEKKCLVW